MLLQEEENNTINLACLPFKTGEGRERGREGDITSGRTVRERGEAVERK